MGERYMRKKSYICTTPDENRIYKQLNNTQENEKTYFNVNALCANDPVRTEIRTS